MDHGVHAAHGLVPARIARQIEFDEAQPVQHAAIRQVRADGIAHLRLPRPVAQRAAHDVAGAQQIQRDPLGDEAGHAGQQDGLRLGHVAPPAGR